MYKEITVNRNRRGSTYSKEELEEQTRAKNDIVDVICSITDRDELIAMFDDILTPTEIDDIIQRWLLMEDIYKGIPQRDIASKRKMSLCKITRGSKMLKKEDGFMHRLLSSRYDDHLHI